MEDRQARDARKNKLVIIGNGFDLRYGLKSGYTDFFNSDQIKALSTQYELSWNHYKEATRFLTLWDGSDEKKNENLFLRYLLQKKLNHIENWSDVEQQICHYLEDFLGHGFQRDVKDMHKRFIFQNSEKFNGNTYELANASYPIRLADSNYSNYLDALLGEVNQFENLFLRYLNEATEKLQLTAFAQRDFMNHFIYDSTRSYLYKKINFLSFNYTNIFENVLSSSELDQSEILLYNIHGSLKNDNIIFGIDQGTKLNRVDDLSLRSILSRFSKTARLLNNSTDMSYQESILPSDELGLKIQIFGHSLAQADYSYFQAIFDYYNIYENTKVQIEFCYSKFTRCPSNLKSTYLRSVHALIETYGDTMSNKDKGANLLHKLLIERRITITELPEFKESSKEENK